MRAKVGRWRIGLLLLACVLVLLLAGSLASAEGICYDPPKKGLMHTFNNGDRWCTPPVLKP